MSENEMVEDRIVVKGGLPLRYKYMGDKTFAEVVSAAVSVVSGPATIAEGADINAGATTDVAVVTDVPGTLSAKLRGIVKMLASYFTIWSSVDAVTYAASGVIKASAGTLLGVMGFNSNASGQFIQIYNSATIPIDTTVPILTVFVPGTSNFSIDFSPLGKLFSIGISWSNSSTGPTKTIGASDCWINVQYK
jgi:hypothetical protein